MSEPGVIWVFRRLRSQNIDSYTWDYVTSSPVLDVLSYLLEFSTVASEASAVITAPPVTCTL